MLLVWGSLSLKECIWDFPHFLWKLNIIYKSDMIHPRQKSSRPHLNCQDLVWLSKTPKITFVFVLYSYLYKWGWNLLSCWNDFICNLHQTYFAISVIHSMLKWQYYRSRIFTKCVNKFSFEKEWAQWSK